MTYSPDGRWWWDGRRWVSVAPPVATSPPASTSRPSGRRGCCLGLAGVIAAAATLVGAATLLGALAGPSSLAGRPSQVVFDDDFSTNKGWAPGPTETLVTGHPGTLRLNAVGEPLAYPGAAYERVKIVATMSVPSHGNRVWTSDLTDIGLACMPADEPPGLTDTYQFWAGRNPTGTARVFGVMPHRVSRYHYSTELARAHVDWSWPFGLDPGQSHTVTAICYSGLLMTVSLELLLDGKTLITTTGTGFLGPFQPAILADGEVDVHRFTVSTVS